MSLATAPEVRPRLAGRLGGTDGNERLTALTAVTLFGLLAVEGLTIVFLGQLLWVHLFVGVVLIPPVALKLGSTGWRPLRQVAVVVALLAGVALGVLLAGRYGTWIDWRHLRFFDG
jgi:hypothetical protein